MTIDWSSGYQVAYEYWEVDPSNLCNRRMLRTVNSCTIDRDASDETLGSAAMEIGEPVGNEIWVRVFAVITQRGSVHRECLGTFIAITPRVQMDGKSSTYSLDLYTPLRELADDGPPDGFPIRRGQNAVNAARLVFQRFHAHLVDSGVSHALSKQVVSLNDSWLSFGRKVLEAANMEVALDAHGRIGFSPVRDAAALAPAWTFIDDERSLLFDDAELTCGWSEVPNVVKVKVSGAKSADTAIATATNDSAFSPVSTISRGRIVSIIEENPEGVTKANAKDYAARRLKELSCTERTLSFVHGYCPVRLGDCVRVIKSRNGLDVKGKVISQSISCVTDLRVETEIAFTEVAWNG